MNTFSREYDEELRRKKRTGCGATNACVSLKKESGVIRSDIFSRSSTLADLSSLL